MLKKLVIENFLSIKERTEIDFMKTNYTILPQNVNEEKILKGGIFVGANASGKSNLLNAIKYIIELFFYDLKDNTIFRQQCLFGKKKNYLLEYTFVIDGSTVVYNIEVNVKEKMVMEKLFLEEKILLERKGKSATSYINDKDGITYTDEVPEDSSFLRTIYFNTKFAGNSVLVKWMEFLKSSIACDLYKNFILTMKKDEISLLKYLDKEGTDRINNFFSQYNFEQEIEYNSRGEGKHFIIESDEKMIFVRRRSIDDPIPFVMESLGNRTLIKLLPVFLSVIDNGGMLIIDEFSSGFHNDLEELLVKHFMKYAKNSQLFLVSHSTNLLSNSIFRPDQEYSVYFDGVNGSKLRRFSDEQPRNAQNIEKMYNSGVFGGLPNYEGVDDENK